MVRGVLARSVLARAVLVGLGALAAPGPAAAHDGQPALVAEQNVAPPGGSVVVRGEDLGGEAMVRLSLAGGGDADIDLGTFPTDADGHIVLAVAIPPDLPPGAYELRAAIETGAVVGVPIRVDGAPVDPGQVQDGQGGRDEDDPLLIALPEGWQQSLSSPAAAAQPSPVAAASPAAAPAPSAPTGSVTPLVLLAAGLVLGAVAATVLRRLPRRS